MDFLKIYFNLMPVAWGVLLRPKLELNTLEGSSTLDLEIDGIWWAFLEANFLAILTVLALMLLPETYDLKWTCTWTFWVNCVAGCNFNTLQNIADLFTKPSMMAADNFVAIQFKMALVFVMQLFGMIQIGYTLYLEYTNRHREG